MMDRVNDLIERVSNEHPSNGRKALATYYEAVHQELAPLARQLEVDRDKLLEMLKRVYPRALAKGYEEARALIAEVEASDAA